MTGENLPAHLLVRSNPSLFGCCNVVLFCVFVLFTMTFRSIEVEKKDSSLKFPEKLRYIYSMGGLTAWM